MDPTLTKNDDFEHQHSNWATDHVVYARISSFTACFSYGYLLVDGKKLPKSAMCGNLWELKAAPPMQFIVTRSQFFGRAEPFE